MAFIYIFERMLIHHKVIESWKAYSYVMFTNNYYDKMMNQN